MYLKHNRTARNVIDQPVQIGKGAIRPAISLISVIAKILAGINCIIQEKRYRKNQEERIKQSSHSFATRVRSRFMLRPPFFNI
jgi:hypothetical protein